MIELLKQTLEALEDVGVLTDREWQAVHKNKANELRQAIAELESQEPVGTAGELFTSIALERLDFRPSTKIYTTSPQRTEQNFCSRCGKRSKDIHTCTPPQGIYYTPPQRTWVGLTKDEVDSWNLPDHPTVFEFAQFIESKLKEKNI